MGYKMKNENVVFPTIILKNKKDYLVYVPDLELFTEGNSLANAICMARDIIGLHCMDLEDDKKKIPIASSYEKAYAICKKKHPEYFNGNITMIDVDVALYRKKLSEKTVRRNVSIPEYINDAANKAGINVSKILTNALAKQLKIACL